MDAHRPSTHWPQLDGLRGLAVLAVVAHHTLPEIRDRLNPGAAGVRIFFVLSGFLITGILLRARTEAALCGRSRLAVLAAFYARRALRIFPVYYLLLAFAAALGLPEVRETIAWHLLYLSNHFVAARGNWPPAPLSHLWSLAVEEQFYLVWPTLMLFAPIRRLPMLVAVAAALGPSSRLVFGVLDGGPLRAGVLTVSCLDSLALGAMLALSPARLRRFALSAGLLLLAGVTASSLTGQGWLFRIACKDLAYALVAVWLVDRATRNRLDVAGRLLAFGPLRYLGTVSYGVYLYHDFLPPALRALGLAAWLPPSGFPKFLAVAGLSWIVAAVSWHFFEKPLNELKRFFPYVRRPSMVPIKTQAA